MSRTLIALAASASLAGCVSFASEPPESLLTLTPAVTVPAGVEMASATAIKIAEPDAPARLAVNRVPVQIDPTEVAYLKDAVWVERPTRLFRSLLAETVRARGNRMVIDGDDPGLGADLLLRGTLREFGYDATTSSVIVRFDATRIGGDGAAETRRFESVQPGVIAEADPVGAALNRAANEVAGQVADWITAG